VLKRLWYIVKHCRGTILVRQFCSSVLTKYVFPQPVGPVIFAVNGCWKRNSFSTSLVAVAAAAWQPLYDVIRKIVFPRVEFRRGILMDLDSDNFFGPRIRNVIVLDDLMSTAAKDSRINDLFTEGSHHRNVLLIPTCLCRIKYCQRLLSGPSGVHLHASRWVVDLSDS
jgi:hypothetical protein